MCNERGDLWITYNGEIYNFRELREELVAKGYSFTSGTDTEVVLKLYQEEGAECVKRLNGMFAFAICDLRTSSPALFLARDHFGVKPLYYVQRSNRLAFASEIKALLEVPQVEAELDFESLHQYLTFLWVPEPRTMFRNIVKLPAGHHALFRNGELSIRQYWDLTFPAAGADFPRPLASLTEEVQERFRASVRRQMISDVPVGAFLSAGIDSSSIVAMMCEASSDVHTYTVTFPRKYRVGENALDDPQVASRFARRNGCVHREIVVDPEVADLLPRLLWHLDEPLSDPAVIPAYLVCREAAAECPVLLSGVGGDELFAGYRKHIGHYWAERYRRAPAFARRALEEAVLGVTAFRGTKLKGWVRLAKKMARSASLPPVARFIANGTYLNAEQKAWLYLPELEEQSSRYDPERTHMACFDQVKPADFLNQMLYLDTKIFMASLNLNYNDKMSMASSVEVRVPFLDRELAEFVAWNVPPALKLKAGFRPATKRIFRQAMRGLLPEEVLQQPKAGFSAPIDYWLANDLREMAGDLLSESCVRRRGLFKPESVRTLLDQHRRGVNDWSMQIWQLLTLELWTQSFFDQNGACSSDRFRPQVAMA